MFAALACEHSWSSSLSLEHVTRTYRHPRVDAMPPVYP